MAGDTVNLRRPVDDQIEEIAYFLDVRGLNPQRLGDDELRVRYGCRFAVGWKIDIETSAGPRPVDMLLESDYPFREASIGIAALSLDERPKAHVDREVLCLFSSDEPNSIISTNRDLEVALDRAISLFALNGDVAEERRQEFYNYWIAGVDATPFVSLLSEEAPYGFVSTWLGELYTVVADNDAALTTWLRRHFDQPERSFTMKRALYLPGEKVPAKLRDGATMMVAVSDLQAEARDALGAVATERPPSVPVVFRLGDEFALVAGYLNRPVQDKTMVRKAPFPGFRKGHEPRSHRMRAYYSEKAKFERAKINRADAAWVLARGGEKYDRDLAAATVCLIGVGALGSGVARLLVKAGVGHLVLVDPDVLTWDNVARHELGGSRVRQLKVKAMAATLGEDFPFVEVRAVPNRWQDALRESPSLLDVDVVLSTTAVANDDVQLNALFRTERRETPLIFGWIEAHAAAAHALSIAPAGGCFACGIDGVGAFIERATNWPGPQIRREPSCSFVYAPYSDLASMRARLLIVQAVIQALKSPVTESQLTTEIYDRSLREEHGGTLSERVMQALGDNPPPGARLTEVWRSRATCSVCAP